MNPLLSIIYGLFQIWFIVGTFYFACTNTFIGDWFPLYQVSDYTLPHYYGTQKEAEAIQNFLDNKEQSAKIVELNKKEEAREHEESLNATKQTEVDPFQNYGGWPAIKGNR